MVHHDSVSTIHVSLLPPPCEELTTSEPLRKATRVNPPVVTEVCGPLRMNGRRSTCRGSSLSFTSVGTVDRVTTGCAMKLRGSAFSESAELARFTLVDIRPL